MLLMPFLTLAKVTIPDMIYALDATGFKDLEGEIIQPTWALFGLTILIVLLSFMAIFLYTRRVLQMRLTIFGLILKVGFYVMMYIYYHYFVVGLKELNVDWSFGVTPWIAFPIVAMIFDYLAYRGIAVDERTVRFMDRLR